MEWKWPDWDITLEGPGQSRAETQMATEAMSLVPEDPTVAVKVRVKDETFVFVRHEDTFVTRETLRGRVI